MHSLFDCQFLFCAHVSRSSEACTAESRCGMISNGTITSGAFEHARLAMRSSPREHVRSPNGGHENAKRGTPRHASHVPANLSGLLYPPTDSGCHRPLQYQQVAPCKSTFCSRWYRVCGTDMLFRVWRECHSFTCVWTSGLPSRD